MRVSLGLYSALFSPSITVTSTRDVSHARDFHPRKTATVPSTTSALRLANTDGEMKWTPEADLLDYDPSELCALQKLTGRPRLAKDESYARAVQEKWRAERGKRVGSDVSGTGSVGSPFEYQCVEEDGTETALHGHVVRPSPSSEPGLLPGVILFHTGAGPQDIFLRYTADSLSSESRLTGRKGEGCVVFIADVLSDDTGWTWDGDRTEYNRVRAHLLSPHERTSRKENLRKRIVAAVEGLKSVPGVDPKNIAAFGYCLGGIVITELVTMRLTEMKALVSFHGVVDPTRDGYSESKTVGESRDSPSSCRVLVCHGADDPFIPEEHMRARSDILNGYAGERNWELLEFPNVRHGFTNPAQAHNSNDAFGYDETAAGRSWDAAISLLGGTLC